MIYIVLVSVCFSLVVLLVSSIRMKMLEKKCNKRLEELKSYYGKIEVLNKEKESLNEISKISSPVEQSYAFLDELQHLTKKRRRRP